MQLFKLIYIIFFCAIVAGCHNRDTEISTAGKNIYFDYQITGSEEEGFVSYKLQYRENGPEGTPIQIKSPGTIMIDNEPLIADSTRKSGIFYELLRPLNALKGSYRIELINTDGKRYKEELDFQPFTLENELTAEIKRQAFKIKLKNFNTGILRLVLIDTVFQNNGINELVTVKNGEIGITQFMLDRLKNGPVILKLYMEQEKSIKNGTQAGGMLHILYSLERDFKLID